MARSFLTKTSFTAGELDPRLLGRLDLRAQEDGASRLRNVLVQPTGGVTRRPGTRFVAAIADARRLISFDGPDGGELLVLAHFSLSVVANDAVVQTIATPWSAAHLANISWARYGDRLLVCHPDIQPRQLIRKAQNDWEIKTWAFERADDGSADPPRLQPYARFAPANVTVQAVLSGTPASDPIPAGSTVTLTFFDDVLNAGHYGTIIRIKGKEISVTSVASATSAVGLVLQALPNGYTTASWDEQAFSSAHGWPASITFHQNRLVIGGSRDLPDHLWLSKTGRPFDFDLGTGLDDEAIAFRLVSDRQHIIRSLFAGRHLQLFTTAGEWVVKGFPLTPGSVQLDLQTRIGTLADRLVPPVDVDGATLFVAATGRELREFLYTDTEQAYQAADIALLARHLMVGIVDIAFDQGRRLCLLVRDDGSVATITIDRNSNVVAWSLQTTEGRFLAACHHAGGSWLLAERDAGVFLERLDETLALDSAIALDSGIPRVGWTGLGHLNGATVDVFADGQLVRGRTVSGGLLTVPTAATHIVAGLPFGHEVEALPLMASSAGGLGQDTLYRPVRVSFRLLETMRLEVDTGMGLRQVPLPATAPPGFTGDAAIRSIGWRRGVAEPPWRVVQDQPLPCTILSVSTEIRVND